MVSSGTPGFVKRGGPVVKGGRMQEDSMLLLTEWLKRNLY